MSVNTHGQGRESSVDVRDSSGRRALGLSGLSLESALLELRIEGAFNPLTRQNVLTCLRGNVFLWEWWGSWVHGPIWHVYYHQDFLLGDPP